VLVAVAKADEATSPDLGSRISSLGSGISNQNKSVSRHIKSEQMTPEEYGTILTG
jgi:hypothetical protein